MIRKVITISLVGVIAISIFAISYLLFTSEIGRRGTSPGVTIEVSGTVIDAPDITGQVYIKQENGTTTIILR